MSKIAYLGPNGTFSEEAALKFFAEDADTEWVMLDSIPDVLEAVSLNVVDKCMVPIENSIAGNIHMTIDGLLLYNLRIEADVVFKVSLHLIGNQGSAMSDIQAVRSIMPAINQCRQFIKEHGLKLEYADSTAHAALSVKESGDAATAAIGSASVAEKYGLQILQSNVQDHSANHTRFVVVSKKPSEEVGHKKTMMLITPSEEYPGVLSSILNVFSALGINLSWIESRPTGRKLGEYRFLIETEAGGNEQRMDKAIKIIETFGHDVHVLGSYATTVL
ncbi:prephenate dehydratase [Paenibacillus glycanilyticus]|uniref:Prephenate dehydratase n=1 Tax=Paenibacillus glycanilyticus TaxID=126569 RepID=A0ABQ6GHI4_9BACL|nr:prephenate dehydratase [Paenibacillus glycanilyticus]GLX70381.1 chorismate mutase [Paenibacillus glycanilyticus]